jgi:hypothetical protein
MNEDVVSHRLQHALDEQARLSQKYDQSIGTSYELAAYARLQAATLAVANCDRIARKTEAEAPPSVS